MHFDGHLVWALTAPLGEFGLSIYVQKSPEFTFALQTLDTPVAKIITKIIFKLKKKS